jgi:hypothetical protein
VPVEPPQSAGDDVTQPPAARALAELIEAARRARDCSLGEDRGQGYQPITPIVWLYRDGTRVAAFRCADVSLTDALDLVLNAVPTYAADTVAMAFEGFSHQGPGDRPVDAIHVVRRERNGCWHAGCLPYAVDWFGSGGGGPRVDWSDERLPGVFSSGSKGDELELQGVAAAALDEAFARTPPVTEDLLAQLQEELDVDAAAARQQADLDVTYALLALGRGRWSIDEEPERPASAG